MKYRCAPWIKDDDTDKRVYEDTKTEQLGYQTTEQMVNNLIRAGENLQAYRKGTFTEENGEFVRKTYTDFDEDYESFSQGIDAYKLTLVERTEAEKARTESDGGTKTDGVEEKAPE